MVSAALVNLMVSAALVNMMVSAALVNLMANAALVNLMESAALVKKSQTEATRIIDDARKSAAEERSAVFDRLLSNNSQSSSGAQDSTIVGSLGMTKTPPTRSQQFQSLLSAPPAAPTVGLFSSPLNAAAAPRAAAGSLAERPSTAIAPVAAPIAPKAPPIRLEPRPALLQIPTRGF
jgi:hypothetical protein